MKTFLLSLLLVCLCACSREHQNLSFDRELVVVIDHTDFMTRPNAKDIMAQSGLDQNIYQGVRITITDISDVSVTETKIFFLPRENPLLGNKKIRQAKIAHLEKDIEVYLSSRDSVNTRPYSVIYRKLSDVLNEVASTKALHKVVLIYSDCMENSSVSFYAPEVLEQVQHNPTAIRQQLEKEAPLHDLSSVHIYFQFTPHNFTEDTMYQIASSFYMNIYQAHGAIVKRTVH